MSKISRRDLDIRRATFDTRSRRPYKFIGYCHNCEVYQHMVAVSQYLGKCTECCKLQARELK